MMFCVTNMLLLLLPVQAFARCNKVTVWCGFWAGGVIGPYFFENDVGEAITVTGECYRTMTMDFFEPKLNDMEVDGMWFQQDGATCHTVDVTLDILHERFEGMVISRRGDVNWKYSADFDLSVTLRSPQNSRIKGECRYSYQGRTYHAFTNIPYAEPPIGKRRLQKPEPIRPWKGIYDATDVDILCVQDSIFPIDVIRGTEDCLVLHVYTPMISKNSSSLFPVLFWIHGGAFQLGSGMHIIGGGFFDKYDPSFLMDETVVVVSVNYRLGALGFLTTEDDVIPANLGLRDQNLALKWVQENIDLFGGDPKDIVISGESAGAASVCYHLLSNGPEMKSVTGAIMISGTCLAPWALNKDARMKAFDVGKKLGNDHSSDDSSASLLKLFQSLPVDRFFHATKDHYMPIKTNDGSLPMKWSPVYAKEFYPSGPMTDDIDQGRFHKVPLLFGFNSEECLSLLLLEFLPQARIKAKVWDQDPSKMIATILNVRDRHEAGGDMKSLYTNKSFHEDIAALVKYCTDDQFTLPIGRHAESASKYGVPVYMYILAFQFIPHFTPGVEGVGHAEDLLLFWNTFFTKAFKLLVQDYKLMSKRLVKLLTNFVKYKKPIVRQEDLFQNMKWPKFESKYLQYMNLDIDLAVHSNPRNYSAKRIVWDKHLQQPISVY